MMSNTIGSLSLIKKINTGMVLNTIRDKGAVSRAAIARLTGLTPATVSNITAQLISSRLICETTSGKSSGGRKPIILEMRNDSYCIIGIFLDSRNVKMISADLSANVLLRRQIDIPEGAEPSEIIQNIIDTINSMDNGERKILGIGMGLHGLVDTKEGLLIYAPNLKWENLPIKAMLEEALGIKVCLDNDVRLMSLGENWYGCARNEENFVYLYVGYGIGGSLVLNGRIYRGNTYGAGELGHTTISAEGPLCECGNKGCLQALASEAAILQRLEGHIPKGAGIDYCINNAAVDKRITAEFKLEASYLGIAIGNLINTFNPALVVVNGRITELGERLMSDIVEQTSRRCMKSLKDKTRVVFSYLGRDAALKGCVAMVMDGLLENGEVR